MLSWRLGSCHLLLLLLLLLLQVLLQGLPGGALEVAQGAVQGTEQAGSCRCSSDDDSSRCSRSVEGQSLAHSVCVMLKAAAAAEAGSALHLRCTPVHWYWLLRESFDCGPMI
jgi:hypothetical protein